MKTRLVAILGGGDWADASVEHLVVPDNVILAEAMKAYRSWYRTYDPWAKPNTYVSFVEFLIRDYGAHEADCTDIETYDDR